MGDESGVGADGGRDENTGNTRKKVVGAYRVASNLRRLWSFFGTKTGAVATNAVGAAALGGVVAVTTPDVLGLQPRETKVARPAAAVDARRLDESALLFPLEGRDARRRRVLFDLVVLSRDLAWVRGSEREITLAGKVVPEREIAQVVFGRELTAALVASKEVIVAGVASVEGAEAAEAERAGRRAATAVGWVEKVVPPGMPLTTLNLGQFKSECSGRIAGDTAWQRPLMVIAVRERDTGADVGEALANALSGRTNLPDPGCYTRFTMRGVR